MHHHWWLISPHKHLTWPQIEWPAGLKSAQDLEPGKNAYFPTEKHIILTLIKYIIKHNKCYIEPGWNRRVDYKQKWRLMRGEMGRCRRTMEDPFTQFVQLFTFHFHFHTVAQLFTFSQVPQPTIFYFTWNVRSWNLTNLPSLVTEFERCWCHRQDNLSQFNLVVPETLINIDK